MNSTAFNESYDPNGMDLEFESFFEQVSCFIVTQLPYDKRCSFVKKAANCNDNTNFVAYIKIMFCDYNCKNKFQELVFMSILVLFCLEMVLWLGIVVNIFYSPPLKVISQLCHMNEHLAGVTFLAFGNSTPNMLSDLFEYEDEAPVIPGVMSASLFISMFTGGLICYLRPFKMNQHATVRDLLFFLLGATTLDFFMSNDNMLTKTECWIMFSIYGTYLIVNIVDVQLMRKAMKRIIIEIEVLEHEMETPARQKKIMALRKKYKYFAEDERVDILQTAAGRLIESNDAQSDSSKFTFTTTRATTYRRQSVNVEANRTHAVDPTKSKNHRLFREFFESINPIDCHKWRREGIFIRTFYIAQAPIMFICALYIPVVDYERPKHGWSKLLNCLQIVLNPALTLTVGQVFIFRKKTTIWYKRVLYTYKYGAYSCVITVPVAIIVFIQSRTNVPPYYHWVFTIMNISGCLCMIYQSAAEIAVILDIIGGILEVPSDFMAITVGSMTNGLSDLVTNVVMALHGYEKMAYAAAIGSSFFNMIISTSLLYVIKNYTGYSVTLFTKYGINAYTFLLLGLAMTVFWAYMLNFQARRSVGIFCMAIYAMFLLFTVLIEKSFIHSYSKDPIIDDTYSGK